MAGDRARAAEDYRTAAKYATNIPEKRYLNQKRAPLATPASVSPLGVYLRAYIAPKYTFRTPCPNGGAPIAWSSNRIGNGWNSAHSSIVAITTRRFGWRLSRVLGISR